MVSGLALRHPSKDAPSSALSATAAEMARPLRVQFPGACYHVTSRGNARQAIYLTDDDRQRFCRLLAEGIPRYAWRCHAFCLMTNHDHLLIETLQPTLVAGMRHLNGCYTQQCNRHHRRVGHVFQGRYTAILVEQEAYLLELSRYVVLNPVRARLVPEPAAWPWSSYRATAGEATPPAWLTTDWLLGQFGASRRQAHAHYRAFVQAGLTAPSPWAQLRGQISLGSAAFCERLAPTTPLREEIPRSQRQPLRPSLAALFAHTPDRAATVLAAYREHGYRLKEIAEQCGVHYATVSR